MQIHYIDLENYRQYRDTRITFSTDLDRKFTVIEGANGAGKSNLLNAITWCLYGEERHLREEDRERQLPIVNEKVYHGLAMGESASVAVEIALGEGEVEYIINRQAQVYRRLDGEISVREDADPRVMYRVQGNWRTSEQPNYTINSLLPADISHFFFFDGEQLNEFFQEDSAEQVRTGIVDVSQIHYRTLSTTGLRNQVFDQPRETKRWFSSRFKPLEALAPVKKPGFSKSVR